MSPLAVYAGDAVPTVITDVAVFDSERAVLDGPFDVRLDGGEISRIVPAGDSVFRAAVLVDGGEIVDGTGHTLLPGLVDVHVHMASTVALPGRVRIPDLDDNAAAFVFAGVTTVVDLATPIETIERLRRRIDRGRIAGPSIYAAGKPFTAPGGHPESTVTRMFQGPLVRWAAKRSTHAVTTADDVDLVVRTEPFGEAFKVMLDEVPPGAPAISDAALERLALAADALDRPLYAHVGRPSDVDRALGHGVDALMHGPYGGALSPSQIAALVAAGIPMAPTLTVWQAIEDLAAGRAPVSDIGVQVLPRRIERALEDPLAHAPDDPVMWGWTETMGRHHDDRIGNARALASAGGTVLVGSDTPFLTVPAGAGTHREIALLIEAGFTPAEVLRMATWTNHAFLQPAERFGAVREGWQADLLLVVGNPLVDPEAIHDVAIVWVDGRRVVRNPR